MSNWSSFKDEQYLMENWRSYLGEDVEKLDEQSMDSLRRIGSVASAKLKGLEDKGAAIRYAQDAEKARKKDADFKLQQKADKEQGKALLQDREVERLKTLIGQATEKLKLTDPSKTMERRAIEKEIQSYKDRIQQIVKGDVKTSLTPAQGQQGAKDSRLGLKFTGEPRIGGTMGTLTPARQDNYQAQDLYVKKSDNRIPDAPGSGAAAGDGAGDGDGTGDQKLPIPVFKKFTGKERETIDMPRASAGSLSSQLMKLYPDIDKAIITQILKDIAGQLKTNNIQIQEAKKLFLEKLISEVRRDNDKDVEEVAAFVKKKDIKPGDIEPVKRLKGVTGKRSFVAVNKKGVGRVYSKDKQGKEEAQDWSKSGEATPEEKLYDLFVRTLKRLDLHTRSGRDAALENEQSYLGAFRFFKAMQLANRSLKRGNLEDDYKKILRKVEPLNEEARYGARVGEESGKGAGKDLKTWLGNMINIFKEDGLADSKRGMAAIKAAKKQKFGKPNPGPRTKADIEREREAAKAAGAETSRRAGKSGVVNTKAVVGPRLKQGGIDLDTPEGRKLQKNMQKVIRRFLRKNLKRVGANPNLIAEQKFEDHLVELLVNYFSKV
jgi:hypothetical protein